MQSDGSSGKVNAIGSAAARTLPKVQQKLNGGKNAASPPRKVSNKVASSETPPIVASKSSRSSTAISRPQAIKSPEKKTVLPKLLSSKGDKATNVSSDSTTATSSAVASISSRASSSSGGKFDVLSNLGTRRSFTKDAPVAHPVVEAEPVVVVEPSPPAPTPPPEKSTGNVTCIYELYNQEFPMVEGSTTADAIDDEYCLTFIMPNCSIHLSPYSGAERTKLVETASEGIPSTLLYVMEEPKGVYQNLLAGNTYYVVVEQEADRLLRDQENQKLVASMMEGHRKLPSTEEEVNMDHSDGRGMDCCTCIYGKPCIDEFGCRDWRNRFDVSSSNGWKGFETDS